MEKKHAMFHEYWKKMNETRMDREEMLDAKRTEFRSMITKLRDNQKRQTDWLFKDIQTYVKDTYLVGQKYTSDVVGIRMEYTKGLTDTLFEARENSRILEIEQNSKYGPAMQEFEEEMRRLRSRIPTERQVRLQKMLADSNAMLVELVNVYTNILHHNFIEVCHTANLINELKTKERRLEREKNDLIKRRNRIKERTEYLHDRVSNLKRQVNAGKEARKKLHRVMREQELLQGKKDVAYINKELTYQENAKLTKAMTEMSDKVNEWYFQVKRNFLKSVIIESGKFKERTLQLTNFNLLVKHLFDVEDGFLEAVDTFKDHEEFEDTKAGLKVLLGSFKPFTLADLEKEFEGCTESFATAIIFFKRRLNQNYLSLDDLHFFIKRRSPLSFLEASRKEEFDLSNVLSYIQKKKESLFCPSLPQSLSIMSFRL
uniref:Myosin-1 n=1 Tax=Lygus hesperus TaxID=30085 RepID=A0A0A9Z1A7_LYGHE